MLSELLTIDSMLYIECILVSLDLCSSISKNLLFSKKQFLVWNRSCCCINFGKIIVPFACHRIDESNFH